MSEPHVWTAENLPSVSTVPGFKECHSRLRFIDPAKDASIIDCFTEPTSDSPAAGAGMSQRWLEGLIPNDAVRTHVHPNRWKMYNLAQRDSNSRGFCQMDIAVYEGKWMVYHLSPSHPVLHVPMNAPHAVLQIRGKTDQYRILVTTWGADVALPTVWEATENQVLNKRD